MAEMTQRVSYGWYFVAFIDLLGQQEGLMKLTQLSPLHENRDKIHDGVLATASRVKSIRETFSHTFNDIPRLVLEKADTVSPEERARYVEFHGGLVVSPRWVFGCIHVGISAQHR